MKPALVCLTPVRNEAWILPRFLECASVWADHIIVADQQSTDASRDIARRFPKVRLIDNPEPAYDEGARQRLLLSEARLIPGPKVLVTLDADEILSANFLASPEWDAAVQSAPGTVLWLRWANLLPGVTRCWLPDHYLAFAFIDDGSPHEGRTIHSYRVPIPPGAPALRIETVRVLHFQYADWTRMRSKHRWYQCLERLRDPLQDPIHLYRAYHHMDALADHEIQPLPPEWLEGYRRLGLDPARLPATAGETLWWDQEVLQWLRQHGCERFRKEAIWDIDWHAMDPTLRDPRNPLDRAVHAWLRWTQHAPRRLDVRMVHRLLNLIGWNRPPTS